MSGTSISKNRKNFGKLLRQLREERGWSYRDLARASKINFANLGALERGERAAGAKVAGVLADALKLKSIDRTAFLTWAFATCRRVPTEGWPIDFKIYQLTLHRLPELGITPEKVAEISCPRKGDEGADFIVKLKTGEVFAGEIKMTRVS